MIKSYPGADFQVLLVNESTITGRAKRRADYGLLLTSWAPVFSPSEVIPVVERAPFQRSPFKISCYSTTAQICLKQ